MFVLCPECVNHYDDSFQSKKCGVLKPGVHEIFAVKPVTEANALAKQANFRRRTVEVGVNGGQRAYVSGGPDPLAGRTALAVVPTPDADTLDV